MANDQTDVTAMLIANASSNVQFNSRLTFATFLQEFAFTFATSEHWIETNRFLRHDLLYQISHMSWDRD